MKCPTCEGSGVVPDIIEEKQKEVLVGHFQGHMGRTGFFHATKGHEVFDDGQRYVIYLKSEQTDKPPLRIPFYKETLKSQIIFI